MSAAPAYAYPQPSRRPQRTGRPDVRAIPGGGRRANESAAASRTSILVKVVIAALVAFSLVCVARVALSAATVSAAVETQQLNQDISSIREQSNALEVTQSTLSNPSNVKATAQQLKMGAPATTEFLDLGVDVVATDDTGNLSLTQSLERAGGLEE
ncbi:MAG: cell division protein FtsL [Eggerthellaceae bacterium]|nr:cell division protein FtsL [Eggerthellaceae bacterium]